MSDDLKGVLAALSEFGTTFDRANDHPNDSAAALKTAGDDVQGPLPSMRKVLSPSDRMLMSKQLSGLSGAELTHLFYLQLAKHDTGVPIGNDVLLSKAMGDDPVISKVLDTTGGAALQRQDLEPILEQLFVKTFPAWQRIRKVPANGLVHAWNQITAYGDAEFMTELGTVTDDNATYVRQTTNIAQLATRRGVTFREQLAVPAGGMSWNPQQIEIEQGLIAMAHKMQKTIFQGQASNSGGTASNELGLYDPNGFTGLRSILNTADAVNFQPYLTSNPDAFAAAIGATIVPITNTGGAVPSVVYMRAQESQLLTDSLTSIQRSVDRTEFVPGMTVPAIATSVGLVPIVGVPGDSIGTYTATSTFDGNTVADLYVLNESSIAVPYLGSPGPSVLEIPPGVSGQLTRLFILYLFGGLAVFSIPFNNKARADLGTT
jgi:hypothetical protein